MIRLVSGNFFRFILLILFQVLILNNIELGGYLNPFLYILFLLMLPFEMADWIVLLLAFLLGITLDMFMDTLGMHSAACVFMAFMRKNILGFMSPREGYEGGKSPNFRDMGISWFFIYSAILVFSHHFVLFFAESFRLSDFFPTLLKIFLSSCFTLVSIIITQLLFVTPKER